MKNAALVPVVRIATRATSSVAASGRSSISARKIGLLEAAEGQVPVRGDDSLEPGESDVERLAPPLDEPIRVEQQ